MIVFTSEKPLSWGELDVPLLGLELDWFGQPLVPMAGFSLVKDPSHLWFLASHPQAAQPHPQAMAGGFQPDLWRYDVAELFLRDPASGRYVEFNLAPNGAWWSCLFDAPRTPAAENAVPQVTTFAEVSPDGAWLAAMAIPLDFLQAQLDFGPTTGANVTMILNSPAQRFLSATRLPGEQPDFHQPAHFSRVSLQSVGLLFPPD